MKTLFWEESCSAQAEQKIGHFRAPLAREPSPCVYVPVCPYVCVPCCFHDPDKRKVLCVPLHVSLYVCPYMCVLIYILSVLAKSKSLRPTPYTPFNSQMICACMYPFVCKYECMHACMHLCLHVCMHVCIYVCMHACMYVCMYVCMYIMYMTHVYNVYAVCKYVTMQVGKD